MADIDELELKISALKELVLLRMDNADKAVALQAKEYERRLDSLNNEASRLRTMQTTYLPREVYDSQYKELNTKIANLELHKANMEGKASQSAVFIAWGIGIAGIILSVISLFMK